MILQKHLSFKSTELNKNYFHFTEVKNAEFID